MLKILFCALNEASNIKKLLANINRELQALGHDFEIIVCIDGSTDESLKILQEYQKSQRLKVLPLKNERGLGLAYKRLFLDVINNSKNDDLIISLDADNTHDPAQISEMLKTFAEKNLDVVVASRFCNVSVVDDFPVHRRFISRITSILLQNLFPIIKPDGKKLKDYTSGYRIYKAEKLRKLFEIKKDKFITEPEFTYTCELLIKLSRLNCIIEEIPISYDYGKKIGKSKLRILRNFWRLMILIVSNMAQR